MNGNTPPAAPATGQRDAPLRVFFDGACPVCSREIAWYRARPGADRFSWVDVSRCPPEDCLPQGREAALARMHVALPDGTVVSGAAAFAAMWAHMPGLIWLGRLLTWPIVAQAAEGLYRLFLIARKSWRRT